MKKITNVLLVFLISIASLKAQNPTIVGEANQQLTQAEVTKSIEDGVVSFVKSVKSTMGSDFGANYEEFKSKLIGVTNAQNLPVDGNNLLSLTYQLIQSNADENTIKTLGFNTFKLATLYVLNNELTNQNPSKSLNNGGNSLFGSNESAFKGYDASESGRAAAGGGTCPDYRTCAHWYSFGCHLHNTGVWICQHALLLTGIYYAIQIINSL